MTQLNMSSRHNLAENSISWEGFGGIMTDYGLDGQGSITAKAKMFFL
jgi:hypothetical protein